MSQPAYLERPVTKQIKEAPVGNWNFKVLFFGPFAPLMRGDFKWTVLMCVPLVVLVGVNSYNFWYLKDMLKKGYKIKSLPPEISSDSLGLRIKMNLKDHML